MSHMSVPMGSSRRVYIRRQVRAENTFNRYKEALGGRLHARVADAQAVEARLACIILSRVAESGMPSSFVVGFASIT